MTSSSGTGYAVLSDNSAPTRRTTSRCSLPIRQTEA